MKKLSKKLVIGIILLFLVILIDITFAFFYYTKSSTENEIVTGQIYLNYTETNQILLSDVLPETKEDALARTNNEFNFKIRGKNTSTKDIYYGISLVEGNSPAGNLNPIDPKYIMIYLERDNEVLIDGIRYTEWNNQKIYVDKIDKGTSTETVKNYKLKMWVDENILISDTDPNASYTTLEWNNSYASLKVNVNGNVEDMNMPLAVFTNENNVENNKAYLNANISNYSDISTVGAPASDNIQLKVSGTNNDIKFSYKNSDQTMSGVSESLTLNYLFEENKTIPLQIFVIPNNDANGTTDVKLELTRNGVVEQTFIKRMDVKGNNYCLNNGFDKLGECILINDSNATDLTTARNNIQSKGTPNFTQTSDQSGDLGLYKTVDDYGDVYYYRGAVTNNNVYFGGYYWKIIRTNGDGSVRMIYQGTTPNATGVNTGINATTYAYNEKAYDYTYVGYMYSEEFAVQTFNNANISSWSQTTKYYWADDYYFDENSGKMVLSGNIVQRTVPEHIDNFATHKYSCINDTGTQCYVLAEVVSFTSNNKATVNFIANSSVSKEATRKNNIDSTAKTVIDQWYETEILNEVDNRNFPLANYLSLNATFCNDRSFVHNTPGVGYALNITTAYAVGVRTSNGTPTLSCVDVRDRFSVTSEYGNGKLRYPISLITADELMYAGGRSSVNSTGVYLNANHKFWTISPYNYYSLSKVMGIVFYDASNSIKHWSSMASKLLLRPVINIKSNVKISQGDGTVEHPFQLTLAD